MASVSHRPSSNLKIGVCLCWKLNAQCAWNNLTSQSTATYTAFEYRQAKSSSTQSLWMYYMKQFTGTHLNITHTYTHTHTHTHTHTYIYIYIHTHTNTHTHSLHTYGTLLEVITVIGSDHHYLAGTTEHDFALSPTIVSTFSDSYTLLSTKLPSWGHSVCEDYLIGSFLQVTRQKKESEGVKSGERGGQMILEMGRLTKNFLNMFKVSLVVWQVASSSWNQQSSSSISNKATNCCKLSLYTAPSAAD